VSAAKLIELEPGFTVFASSALEARFVHREIFLECCYDIGSLPGRPLVADVGANIGLFSVFVKRRYPEAEICAFEPVPHTAAVLRQNIRLHQLAGVTVHEVALGSRPEGDVPFAYFPAVPGSSTRYPEQTGPAKAAMGHVYSDRVADRLYRSNSITVSVQTLSDYLVDGRAVDLLKVDAEGAELDVLLGISPAHWPLIQAAILEVHDYDGRLAAVCDLLSERGMEPSAAPAPLFEEEVRAYTVRAGRRGSGQPPP
jgi:FkbM family methyltransferase